MASFTAPTHQSTSLRVHQAVDLLLAYLLDEAGGDGAALESDDESSQPTHSADGPCPADPP